MSVAVQWCVLQVCKTRRHNKCCAHKLRATPILAVENLSFTVGVVAGNNKGHAALDEICSAGGGCGHRLLLAHLQGDSCTDFSMSTGRNAVVNFQLHHPF